MLTQKAIYAFRALTYLADHYETGPALIADIADKKRIPLKFLEGILLQLRKAGVLESKKGKGGGYFIKNDPSQTTIATIMRAVDGPIAPLPCVSLYFYERCHNCDEQNCGLHDIMEQVRDSMLQVLENKTIADLKTGKEDLLKKLARPLKKTIPANAKTSQKRTGK